MAACKIGDANPMIFAGVVGGLMLIGTLFNLVTIPHPLWFSILGLVGIAVGAWLGMTLGAGPAVETAAGDRPHLGVCPQILPIVSVPRPFDDERVNRIAVGLAEDLTECRHAFFAKGAVKNDRIPYRMDLRP